MWRNTIRGEKQPMVGHDSSALRSQLIDLLHRHPPHNWSTGLLAAVVAVIALELAKDAGDEVSVGSRLHIV